MSINFSDDVNNEIITTAASLPEDSAEGSLRPKTLGEYIGQEKAKANLAVFINAAKCAESRLTMFFCTAPRDSAKPRLQVSSQMRWASTCA